MATESRETEGHRIDHFIHTMRSVGCSFNSGEIPVFAKRGTLEFWEGEFFYKPGRLPLVGKVTLDHNFITLKSSRILSREDFRSFREELHLLLTANQCHYYVEPVAADQEKLHLHITKYIYATEPPGEEVQVALDMLAHAVYDLEKGLSSGFQDWKPKHAP
jgi:hypothetical protein